MKRIFALFLRNVIDDNRRILPYAARMLILAWVCFYGFTMQDIARLNAAPGLMMFTTLIGANLFFLTVFAVSNGASVITEEREERTLGLLMMTGMSAFMLLFGKGLSRALTLLILLAIQTPMFLLAISMGGVRPIQIPAALLCLLAFMFFTLNLAMFFSVVCRRTRKATATTFVTLVMLGVLTSLLFDRDAVQQYLSWRFTLEKDSSVILSLLPVTDWIANLSPIKALAQIHSRGFSGPIVGIQVYENFILGLFFFILSLLLLPRCSQMTAERPCGRLRKRKESPHSVARRPLMIPARPGKHPMIWKDFSFIGGGTRMWLIKPLFILFIATAMITLVFFGFSPKESNYFGITLRWTLLIICAACGAIEYMINLTRCFRTELDQNTLGSLYMLPRSFAGSLFKKVIGSQLSLVPYFVLGGITFLLLIDEFSWDLHHFWGEVVDNPGWTILAGGLWIEGFLFGSVLLIRFSLATKWGAIPLTFFVYPFLLQITLLPLVFFLDDLPEEATAIVIASLAAGALWFLSLQTYRKLIQLAAVGGSG